MKPNGLRSADLPIWKDSLCAEFLQGDPDLECFCLANRQLLLHNCLNTQIKGKGEVSVEPSET